jgi:hypothetical protein
MAENKPYSTPPLVRESSIPLVGGGDTHFHGYGKSPNDFTVTTRIPIGNGHGSVAIHNPSSGDDFNWKP